MSGENKPGCDVLIAGAGPTGLVLALWLTKFGAKVRIIDKTAAAGTTSRALAVQARTLELYRQLDLADEVIKRGHKVAGVNLWAKGRQKVRLAFTDIGAGLSPYSFALVFPQDEHEKLLIERLQAAGVTVERNTELLGFTDHGEGIAATLRLPDGSEQAFEAAYIAGCDGARSVVRNAIGVDFPGGTYRQVFYVADVEATGAVMNGELHIDLDEADFLAVFPLAGEGRARLVGTVRDERADHAETLQFADVSGRAIQNLKIAVSKVNWFSTYRVHHRVTDRFRKGRAFLLGDAAHIHSPAGGQGMNTGIGDAINLAWKLAWVAKGRAPDKLLDSFETERIAFARRLVATTDRAFTFATANGPIANVVRTRIFPFVMGNAVHFRMVREFMFRTVSQITVNYRDGPISRGVAGEVHSGDRLPWVAALDVTGGHDNYTALNNPEWQVHVYGAASTRLSLWCSEHQLPLHVTSWHPRHAAAGLTENALYLLRPDSYIALIDTGWRTEALERYFTENGIKLPVAESA
jgi:2-polyprenyl-6-methoxyphenol hydroxylase-like FAD-dependent oxidoreductase